MLAPTKDATDMSDIERLTITLPREMVVALRGAVASGDYASTSEVVRAALRDWTSMRTQRREELESLKADIEKGLADVAAGRLVDFDREAIIARGRTLLTDRSPCA
jgi:antitoxin ParD1/3/4